MSKYVFTKLLLISKATFFFLFLRCYCRISIFCCLLAGFARRNLPKVIKIRQFRALSRFIHLFFLFVAFWCSTDVAPEHRPKCVFDGAKQKMATKNNWIPRDTSFCKQQQLNIGARERPSWDKFQEQKILLPPNSTKRFAGRKSKHLNLQRNIYK